MLSISNLPNAPPNPGDGKYTFYWVKLELLSPEDEVLNTLSERREKLVMNG